MTRLTDGRLSSVRPVRIVAPTWAAPRRSASARILLLAGLLLCVAAGCDRKMADAPEIAPSAVTGPQVRVVDNAEPISESPWVINPVPLLSIGEVAGAPEYELFRVTSAIRLSDGSIVVGNGSTADLRWFDTAGRHARTVGRRGSGPGEFQAVGRIYAAGNDRFTVDDPILRRLTTFDPGGEIVRTETYARTAFDLGVVARLVDGTYLLTTTTWPLADVGPVRTGRDTSEVYRWAGETDSTTVLASLPGIEYLVGPSGGIASDGSQLVGRGRRDFGRSTAIASAGSGWVTGDNEHPELVFRSPSGQPMTIARWVHSPRPVSTADIRAAREVRLEGRDTEDLRRRLEAAWAQQPPPPATMPAFGQLITDARGLVWVKDYVPLGGDADNRFLVFDPSGVWLSTVVAPKGLRILSIGEDHVIGVTVDDLEVERISVHALQLGR